MAMMESDGVIWQNNMRYIIWYNGIKMGDVAKSYKSTYVLFSSMLFG